jgi:hypothetical protein
MAQIAQSTQNTPLQHKVYCTEFTNDFPFYFAVSMAEHPDTQLTGLRLTFAYRRISLCGRSAISEADCMMAEYDLEPELRSGKCHAEARAALDAAMEAATEEEKSEYLRLAMEWLRLAAEISSSAGE